MHRLCTLFPAVSLIKDLISKYKKQAALDPKMYKQLPFFCNFRLQPLKSHTVKEATVSIKRDGSIREKKGVKGTFNF